MALGSQNWNGNWALLVSAPSAIRTSTAGYQGSARTISPAASTWSMS
ncbi:Uncharacterised protein [Bordetella pertussis]|nr:Uncharacterised protein [Bordetella pertussis]CFW11013.1 Uncharacterised protein [Bordetella pertussis]